MQAALNSQVGRRVVSVVTPMLSRKTLLSLTRYRNSCVPGLSDEKRKCPERAFQQGAWVIDPCAFVNGVGPVAVLTE